jgi:hypothetical protein
MRGKDGFFNFNREWGRAAPTGVVVANRKVLVAVSAGTGAYVANRLCRLNSDAFKAPRP